MPRSGSGTFTLVSGNPVVTGTTIESNWANTTLSDIATTLTDSLSRSGQGGMTAALRIADGTQGAPGVGFANETGSGFYRAGTGEVWAVVQGAQTMNLDASGVTVPSDKATSIEGTFVFNETGADKDARFEGDTDANLLFTDASTDRVGIGTNTPTAKLNVEGSVIINDAGADVDVRIEGDTDANLLVTDASADAVGIGTNTPGAKLNISKASNGATVEMLRLDNGGSGANTAAQVSFRAAATTYATITGGYGAAAPLLNANVATGGTQTWSINASDQMTLTSTGLGIGTSSPTLKLEVSNGTNTGYMHPGIGIGLSVGTKNNSVLTLDTNNTERMRLDTSGNLGLGVTPGTWGGSSAKAFEIGTWSGLSDGGAYGTVLTFNGRYNSGWFYKATNSAAKYEQDGAHRWYIAPSGTAGNTISFTQAMTLDASGNLLVGQTSGSEAIEVTRSGSTSTGLALSQTGTSGRKYVIASTGTGYGSAGNLIFYDGTAAAERARITSGGDLLVGTTTTILASKFASVAGASQNGGAFQTSASANNYTAIAGARNGNNGNVAEWWYDLSTQVGTISVTSTATAYNTSSDYRLKDNPQPLTNSGAFIDALQPKTWEWKTDGSRGVGFIAHEAQAVSPSSVVGEKDAVDADGKPVMQAMEYGSAEFIANIVAELQSLRARVAALEAQ